MTATEVARNFASVLDRAEHGETIVITRGGRRLATLSPASAGNGGTIRQFLASHPVDEDCARDIEAAREIATDELSGAWHDD
ncbi:type II toxin-antitoxin system Phd/YefM family antitoxin [Streptomyces radicis]|nr:type II toxin-antitoxin system prevent-host-death family antitoxin [Streptomyces radicis]